MSALWWYGGATAICFVAFTMLVEGENFEGRWREVFGLNALLLLLGPIGMTACAMEAAWEWWQHRAEGGR